MAEAHLGIDPVGAHLPNPTDAEAALGRGAAEVQDFRFAQQEDIVGEKISRAP